MSQVQYKPYHVQSGNQSHESGEAGVYIKRYVVVLPVSYNIGPKDAPESLLKYVRLLGSDAALNPTVIVNIVKGIIKGETRVLAAGLEIESYYPYTNTKNIQ